MAFTIKQVFVFAACSLMALNMVVRVAAEEGVSKGNSKENAGKGTPVFVLRESKAGGKPDIWLGWLNYQGLSFLQPMVSPFVQPLQPFSEQISQQLLENIPMAMQIYEQTNQVGDQMSGMLNPTSLMGNLGGSGAGQGLSSLTNMIPGLGGR